jgi:predicted nucleotidyltransferase
VSRAWYGRLVESTSELTSEMELVGRALAAFAGLDLALVFGSFARGDQRSDSDIDVAVSGRSLDPLELAAAIARLTGRDVQVIRLHEASIPLLESIIEDGVVVREGRAGAAASWRARVLADLELDRPWYARQRDAWLKHVHAQGL